MTKPNTEAEANLSRKRLVELLDYEPNTGAFYWKVSIGRRRKGERAGRSARPDKQITITIDGRNYFAHRLAFLWMTGLWPQGRVIHRNGNPQNNAWTNLRVAAPKKPKPRKTGLCGRRKTPDAPVAG